MSYLETPQSSTIRVGEAQEIIPKSKGIRRLSLTESHMKARAGRQKGGNISTDPSARRGEPSVEVLARNARDQEFIDKRNAQGFSGMKVKGA